jgi:hypothetical protein
MTPVSCWCRSKRPTRLCDWHQHARGAAELSGGNCPPIPHLSFGIIGTRRKNGDRRGNGELRKERNPWCYRGAAKGLSDGAAPPGYRRNVRRQTAAPSSRGERRSSSRRFSTGLTDLSAPCSNSASTMVDRHGASASALNRGRCAGGRSRSTRMLRAAKTKLDENADHCGRTSPCSRTTPLPGWDHRNARLVLSGINGCNRRNAHPGSRARAGSPTIILADLS